MQDKIFLVFLVFRSGAGVVLVGKLIEAAEPYFWFFLWFMPSLAFCDATLRTKFFFFLQRRK